MEIELQQRQQSVALMNSVANPSQKHVADTESFAPAFKASKETLELAANQENIEQEDKDSLQEVLKQTAELMSMGDRSLKFEMIEDADIYQIQVIDMSDGRVVRKIPADEVLKMIAHLKEQMSDHVDVLA